MVSQAYCTLPGAVGQDVPAGCVVGFLHCSQLNLCCVWTIFDAAGAMMALAEQRLVASGHMVPSSAPHSPGGGSKGHLSEPDSPTSIIPAVLPKSAAPKHNSAAVAYYRHATQRQVQRGPPEQQSSRGSYHDTESGDVIAAVHDLDSMSLTTQLQDLQQQHQALLAGQQPSNGGIGPVANTIVPSGSPRAGSEVHGPSVMANIESIQNVLTALFVASMGLIMSPVFLWHHASVLLTGALVVMLLKAAVVTLVVRMFDVPLKLSLAVGLSMAHIGEFSFVLLSMANQLKLLSSQVGASDSLLFIGAGATWLFPRVFVLCLCCLMPCCCTPALVWPWKPSWNTVLLAQQCAQPAELVLILAASLHCCPLSFNQAHALAHLCCVHVHAMPCRCTCCCWV